MIQIADTRTASKKTRTPETTTDAVKLERKPFNLCRIRLSIRGITPLICNRVPDAVAKGQKADKNRSWTTALHQLPDGGYGFPSDGLKKAMADAAPFVGGVKKIGIYGAVFFPDELIALTGTPTERKDPAIATQGTKKSCIQVTRAEFKAWSAEFDVTFDRDQITAQKIADLLGRAGFSIGIGSWRPQTRGRFGRFIVATAGKVEVVE